MRDYNDKRHVNRKYAEAIIEDIVKLSAGKKPTTMKKGMIRSMQRKRASKLPKSVRGFGGKSTSNPEDARVMLSTTCAMETVTNSLH